MTETLLTPNDKKRLEEYESKTDVELALLSVYQGDGIDSKNRAALAKYVLDRRNAEIRDGREERTLKIAEEAKNATIKQACWAQWSAVIGIVALIVAAFPYIKEMVAIN